MKDINTKDFKVKDTVFLYLLVSAASLVMAYSFVLTLNSPLQQILILVISSFVASLVCSFEFELPKTKGKFQPKILFAFWGIMWLGIPGGIILGTVAAVAGNFNKLENSREFMAGVSRDIISVFAGALAFISVHSLVQQYQMTNSTAFMIPNEIIWATAAMAATHYLVSAIINFASGYFLNFAIKLRNKGLLNGPKAVIYACVAAMTLIMFTVFGHFGIDLGLVLIPIAIAGRAGYQIHKRSLAQKTKELTEASRMHLATVEALATAIDARDQIGMGHVRRTQIYAVGLGNIMGLGDEDILALRTGALLHDIGKLAVPDHILNKPGSLTPAEMEKMKTHSLVGASILEKVSFPYAVVPTVKYHHESWDGAGYPEGLKGKNIPLTARILAVADAYDTLRGERPYRGAVPREQARSFIELRSGIQFDPRVVDCFLRNLDIFEKEIEAQGLGYDSVDEKPGKRYFIDQEGVTPNFVEQIKQANREVFTLYSLARDFSSSLDVQNTVTRLTSRIAEFVPYDTCIVYLMDANDTTATAVFVEGKNKEQLTGNRVTIGAGATGYALQKRRAVENVNPVLDFAFSQLEVTGEYISMISLPLVVKDKLVGAVSLYSCTMTNYQDEHVRLLETISRIGADGLYTALKHAEAESNALTDPMTGLPNSRSLMSQFDKERTRAERSGESFQMLVMDLDGFKSVNDSFGHKVGDAMLKAIGSVIHNELREYDFLARYGGDEFVALIPDTNSTEVRRLCQRIKKAVNNFSLQITDTSGARVGVSLGAAGFGTDGLTFDEMIEAADKKMYKAKRLGSSVTNDEPLQDDEINMNNSGSFIRDNELMVSTEEETTNVHVDLDEKHIVSSNAIN